MKVRRIATLLVVFAGTAAAGALSLQVAKAGESGGAAGGRQEAEQEPPAQEGAEELQLTEREQIDEGGHRVRVGDTQFISSDIFDFSDTANDLFVWAWLPTISGDVTDNGFFGGQKVEIAADANIGGDVFVLGQTAAVRGSIGGDLYAFVADLTISEGARVDGAIHGSSGALTVNGEVGGPVSYAGGAVVINGTVRGDLKLEAGELEIGPEAVIEGSLSYESAREATIDPGAVIEGDIQYFAPRETSDDDDEDARDSAGWFSVWGLMWDSLWLISSFLVGAIALAVGGDVARAPASRLGGQPALGLGFGFVVAVVFPAAAILAMILIVTIPLGLISLALYVAAAYLARLVAAQTVGAWLLGVARGSKETSAYASLAVGLLALFFLMKIPYVGFLIWIAAIVAGLGGIFLATRGEKDDPGAVAAPVMVP